MPLSPETEAKIRAEADRRGLDPDEAVKRAGGTAPTLGKGADAASGRPVADRLLIGFLPFIKVRELRSLWLGLDERIADDELTCGDYQIKHGGAAPAPASPEAA